MAIPSDKLLISIEHIKKYTPINGSVDQNSIYPFIVTAQDTYLVDCLGTDLYDKIITDAEAETITGIYATIKDNYIPKLLCWKVAFDVYDHLVVKIDNGGLVTRISSDATPPSQRQVEALKDRAKHNLNNYTTRLIDYLCANSSSIPEYTSNVFPDQHPMHKRSYSIDPVGGRKPLPRWMTI
jgi:hypothetical protein